MSENSLKNEKMLIGKIILKGTIQLISPLKVGSDKRDNTDTDILKDKDGDPYIPATAFIGVLKHSIKLENSDINLLDYWGDKRNEESNEDHKSRINCSDLILRNKDEKKMVEIRDGIRIDNKTGLVENKAKYNFEVVRKGISFSFHLELDVYDYEKDKKFISTIIDLLEKGKIKIGSKTNSGFGEIKLIDRKFIYLEFSKNKKQDVLRWIKRDFDKVSDLKLEPLKLANETFSIKATFSLKNSILIKSYIALPNMPDSVHLKSGGVNIISGTSLKGSIRSRAEIIINTLGLDKLEKNIFYELFGNVNLDNKKERPKKGKVKVNEIELPEFMSEMQTRIKINRFTGGTIDGALFESMPLFTDFNKKVRDVTITIDGYKDYEVAILLLVLKDLWSGDIAVGGDKGIGRGVFQGESATIEWNDKKIEIGNDISKLSDDNKNDLEYFVKELVNQGVA